MHRFVFQLFACFTLTLFFVKPQHLHAQSGCNFLCNTDFEDDQLVSPGNFSFVSQSSVSCWNTTASDGIIEVWGRGFQGVPAYSGDQFIELNANMLSTLYQDFTASLGSNVTIAFAHRGRAGVDVLTVEIGPQGGPYSNLGNFSADNTAWKYNTVSYTIPSTGSTDYTLRFKSVSSTGNVAYGNFLDAIAVKLPEPTVDETIKEPGCPGASDGSISLNVSGGSSPYTYSWSAPLNSTSNTVGGLGAGTYEVKVTDFYGCSVTRTYNLVAQSQGYNISVSVDACDSFTWSATGLTYKQNGLYTAALKSTSGCDSNVNMTLRIQKGTKSFDTVEVCGSYTWPLNNQTYTSSGQYQINAKTSFGCDSSHSLTLTILPSYIIYEDIKAADNYTWPVNQTTYNQSGEFSELFKSGKGCDSLRVLRLIIDKNDTVYISSAFTPDGNGLNETWAPVGNNIEWYTIMILSRWGEILYKGGQNQPFDGTYMGDPLMDGIYPYIITIHNKESERSYKRGTLVILH